MSAIEHDNHVDPAGPPPRRHGSHGPESPLFPQVRPEHGHTLVELLVAIVLLGMVALFPAVSLIRHVGRIEARSSSIVWEGGAAAAQIDALWSGSVREIRATRVGLEVFGQGMAPATAAWGSLVGAPTANVSRWRRDGAVIVRFLPSFGAPDGAGSLYFGSEGSGQRVVVRVESGLTRRTSW